MMPFPRGHRRRGNAHPHPRQKGRQVFPAFFVIMRSQSVLPASSARVLPNATNRDNFALNKNPDATLEPHIHRAIRRNMLFNRNR
jgi:hypothetical protein